MIVADYDGVVPADMKELVKLPGVGRKTANIVLNVGYGIVDGIAVDTHVNRIAHRLKLSPKTHEKEPLKTEQDLLKILPREYWNDVNHQWIMLGREICDARKPLCGECPLADICPSAKVGRIVPEPSCLPCAPPIVARRAFGVTKGCPCSSIALPRSCIPMNRSRLSRPRWRLGRMPRWPFPSPRARSWWRRSSPAVLARRSTSSRVRRPPTARLVRLRRMWARSTWRVPGAQGLSLEEHRAR